MDYAQRVFLVASASREGGNVNVSPKGRSLHCACWTTSGATSLCSIERLGELAERFAGAALLALGAVLAAERLAAFAARPPTSA